MKHALVLLALTLACNTPPPQGRTMKATHENGLSFEYDQRVRELVRLAEGYTLELSPANGRAINEITLRVQEAPVPDAGGWQEKTIGARTYRFVEHRLGGGSGGDEYTLMITTPVGTRWLVLEQHVQSEVHPDFELAWEIVEKAQLR